MKPCFSRLCPNRVRPAPPNPAKEFLQAMPRQRQADSQAEDEECDTHGNRHE